MAMGHFEHDDGGHCSTEDIVPLNGSHERPCVSNVLTVIQHSGFLYVMNSESP